MKKTDAVTLLVTTVVVAIQPLRAADKRPIAASHSVVLEHRHQPREAHRSVALSAPDITGVIPRAIRGGNPLQMLNAVAPAKYGTAEENVSLDSDLPREGNGIKLFSISF
jgi:hypothetical protein